MPLQGGVPAARQRTAGAARWSPQGDTIAFSRRGSWTTRVDGSHATHLATMPNVEWLQRYRVEICSSEFLGLRRLTASVPRTIAKKKPSCTTGLLRQRPGPDRLLMMSDRRRLSRPLYLVATLVALLSLQSHAATRSFIWKDSNARGSVYLAGSVHLLTPDYYPLAPAFQTAFDNSERLLVKSSTWAK